METPFTPDISKPSTDEKSEEPASFSPYNKFLYPEFASWEGERLLKSILHKILPMALYRTWEVLVERQAPGNDCFLSIASISETLQRVERTIRLNIHELEARQLLVLRPEEKLFRQADGSFRHKLVVVKDFSGLYALAHEYLLWTESHCYIPPEREFADVIRSNEALKRKLIRFNNYRRIIENKIPGPKPVEREEHRWYTEYDPSPDSQGLGVGGTATPINEKLRAGSAEEHKTSTERNLYLQKDLQKDLKKDSVERIKTSNQNKQLREDSFDSETNPEGGGDDYTKIPNEQQTVTERGKDSHTQPTKTNRTNPSPVASGEMGGGAKQSNSEKRADLDEKAQAFVQRAMSAYEAAQGPLHSQNSAPKAKPNALVRAFVCEVSTPFHDRNAKASLTRALRVVEQGSLKQKDILACLVKAYLVTQETKTVKPQHHHPDGDNKMPLFVTMFARFAADCARGKFGYSDEHLARDIAGDDRLVLFLVEHKLENLLLEGTDVIDVEQEEAGQAEPDSEDAVLSAEYVMSQSLPSSEEETRAEAEQLVEEPYQPGITVAHPDDGWATWESANYWGRYLRDHYSYGNNDYSYIVQPAYYEGQPTGRWLFTFYAHSDSEHCWAIYGHTDEVNFHLRSAEKVWTAYDGVAGRPGDAN